MKLLTWLSFLIPRLIEAAVILDNRQYRLDVMDETQSTTRLCLSVGSCRYTCVSDFYDNTSVTVPTYQSHICPNQNDYVMTLIYGSKIKPNTPDYLVNPYYAKIPCQYGGKNKEGYRYYNCPPIEDVYTESLQSTVTPVQAQYTNEPTSIRNSIVLPLIGTIRLIKQN